MSKNSAGYIFLILLCGTGVVFWVNQAPSIGVPLIGAAIGALLGAAIRSRKSKRRD
ncbi:Putative membrane protein [Amycolatopsis japonica]|uniref:Putative membrane protein n=1 Tax=Amycolatopsis japonica TaxID=208439 RepID=A0A075UZV3_9PSEU|nr:Putative membrane protein [Amycolatopsis japonica]